MSGRAAIDNFDQWKTNNNGLEKIV